MRHSTPTLSHASMRRLGWERIDPRPWKKTTAVWRSCLGYQLEHCGHPTALHSWALRGPDGGWISAPSGLAWPSLHSAVEHVLHTVHPTRPCRACGARPAWALRRCGMAGGHIYAPKPHSAPCGLPCGRGGVPVGERAHRIGGCSVCGPRALEDGGDRG